MSKTLYVGNLPFEVTEDELHSLFSGHGSVKRTKLIMDQYTGKSRGFGFIDMDDDGDASTVIQKMNGFQMKERSLVVNEARPKKDQGGRNFSNKTKFKSKRDSYRW